MKRLDNHLSPCTGKLITAGVQCQALLSVDIRLKSLCRVTIVQTLLISPLAKVYSLFSFHLSKGILLSFVTPFLSLLIEFCTLKMAVTCPFYVSLSTFFFSLFLSFLLFLCMGWVGEIWVLLHICKVFCVVDSAECKG